jgi:MFS family permease
MAVRTARDGQWRALLGRGFDAVTDLSDLVAQKISVVTDPRTRGLRRRRRALRWGLIFTVGVVFWALVTTLLASWSTPFWVLLITMLIAAGEAIPATLLLLRYRWLRKEPLPSPRPANVRRLPPPGSAARRAMSALGASERGFFSLLGVMERGAMLPTAEIRDLTAAANQTSAAMAATAAQVVSMERASHYTESSRPHLAPTINAFTAQLSEGVRQYNVMVTAAAQLVASANGQPSLGGPVASSQQRYREELGDATDRLIGWAQAFDELGGLQRR